MARKTRRKKRGGSLQVTDTFSLRRLSGPVSAYYLTHPTLPTILFFGDLHNDSTPRCDNCSLNSAEPCIRMEDPAFLQALDQVESPIDFYTEFSPLLHRYQTTPENGVLHYDFLKQTVAFCHGRQQTRKESCPTRNIRWHYADVRYMDQYAEYHGFFSMFLYLRRLMEKDIQGTTVTFLSLPEYLKKTEIQNKKRANLSGMESTSAPHREEAAYHIFPAFLERVLAFPVWDKSAWTMQEYATAVSHLRQYRTWITNRRIQSQVFSSPFREEVYAEAPTDDWESLLMEVLVGHVDQIIQQQFPYYSALTDIKRARQIRCLVHITRQMAIYFRDTVIWMWSTLGATAVKSGLLKQLEKQPRWRDPAFWIQSTYRAILLSWNGFDLLASLIYDTTFHPQDTAATILHGLQQAILGQTTYTASGVTARGIAMLKMIRALVLQMVSHLTDTYTLLRMFKTPKDGQPATLCMAYFGNLHVVHMVQQLLDPSIGYTLEYAHESDGKTRCVPFTEPLRVRPSAAAAPRQTKKHKANYELSM